ncbi:MAG: PTS sugar transporter subunit IIB [Deltaproteobacteria bacterium]|jgi:PTS system mannose-specific IIB component|nr:PTS sugar transporter subunit IIB [Deltaproteobacteria bacterium]
MIWYRIDNRLIHGQVIEAWLPYTRAGNLVVANNEMADEPLRQQILLLAVPSRIHTEFARLDELPKLIAAYERKNESALILFANCRDARSAYDLGLAFDTCNVGNLHYGPDKKQICSHVAISPDDEACLRYLEENEVALDFRSIPADNPQVKQW